jgi:hypothetical protein
MDLNFYSAIQELNKNKVFYWVCHGSLLGLARNGELIPWDHDIDIAVWEGEYTEEYIINIFELIGFKFQKDHPEGSLNFTRSGGRSVDVNFYKNCETASNLVCVLHRIPNSKMASLLDKVAHGKEYKGQHKIIYSLAKFFKFILLPLYLILDRLGVLYTTKGYSTHKDLLIDFIYFDYFGVNCKVPKNFKSINSFIYGEKWRIPNKKYNWLTDSLSVTTKASR